VIARHLENADIAVQVLSFTSGKAVAGDAGVNLRVLRAAGTPVREIPPSADADELDRILKPAEWIVDALLGTGTRGEIREPFAAAIEAINRAGARVFAVDLPSGLDCDQGEPLGPCVRAELTGTFVGMKQGFRNPGADPYTGSVRVIDIGVPRRMLTSSANQEK
jgi:NAD(P)H-hydrate epimerase